MQIQLTPRLLQQDDLNIISQIENETNHFPWKYQHFSDCLKAGYKAWGFSIDNGEIIGFAIIQKVVDEAHLLNICVKKPYQGQGVGRKILDHVLNHANEHNFSLVILEVRRSNKRAQNLYLSMGFNEISVRKDYYPAEQGREDAIMMAKDLMSNTFFAVS